MQQSLLGTYYKERKLAVKKAEEITRLTKNKFEVLSFKNGFIVVSEKQLKNL